MAIDKKDSRLVTLGGSEVERLCRDKEQTIPKMSCNCGGKFCNFTRQYTFEDSYTLYLEKCGVRASSWDKSGTTIANGYADQNGIIKHNFDPYLIGEKISVLHNDNLVEKIRITQDNLEYQQKITPNAIVKFTVDNGNFHFGNHFEVPIRDYINGILGSDFQEANKWRTDNDFTVINVDGYDPNFDVQLLEIKTAAKKSYIEDPRAAIKKYYHQIMRYMDVAYKIGKIKDKKIILAIYLKEAATQHLSENECKMLLDKTFNPNNIVIYEISFDNNYYHAVHPKIERFRQLIEHFKVTGEVLNERDYKAIIFEKANKNIFEKRLK